MLPFEKALKTVLDSARQLGSERVDIAHAVNRILAEDVTSDTDMPMGTLWFTPSTPQLSPLPGSL